MLNLGFSPRFAVLAGWPWANCCHFMKDKMRMLTPCLPHRAVETNCTVSHLDRKILCNCKLICTVNISFLSSEFALSSPFYSVWGTHYYSPRSEKFSLQILFLGWYSLPHISFMQCIYRSHFLKTAILITQALLFRTGLLWPLVDYRIHFSVCWRPFRI